MVLKPDTLLKDRYRMRAILGQGGMGAVYRALDENLGVEVAVKENLFTLEQYNRQFRREATIMATLRHPNLPRVFDHFEIEGQGQYLVMDYIEGEDLRQRMDRVGLIPEEEVIIIGAAMCDALQYLHTRQPPILHRDLKPGNIKISPNGDIYLVDFGLAKIMEGSRATTTGARAMTPGYSSPEQYGTARTDARSDIYSLGATLYAALTGVIPEDGLARAMGQADLTPVRKRNAEVSRRMARALEKSLAVNPEERYRSADEFKADLLNASALSRRRVDAGELTIVPPPETMAPAFVGEIGGEPTPPVEVAISPPGELAGRKRRRRGQRLWRGVVVALLAFLLFGGGGGYFFTVGPGSGWLAGVSPAASATVTVERPEPTAGATVEATVEMVTETVPIEPSQTPTLTTPTATREAITPTAETPVAVSTPLGGGLGQVAFASTRSGLPQVWLVDVASGELRQITDEAQGACQPEWSPDGDQLVYISPCKGNFERYDDAQLYLINVDGSNRELVGTQAGSFDPAWSPDGETLLFSGALDAARVQLFRLRWRDEVVERLTDNDKLNFQPVWSPDGVQIVFVSSLAGGYRLHILPNEGNQTPQLYDLSGSKRNTSPDWSPDGGVVIFTQRETEFNIPGLIMLGVDVPRTTGGYFEEKVAGDTLLPQQEADFSPDGLWIAFEGWPDGRNHNIYLMHVDQTELRLLTDHEALDFDAAWRPAP